MFETTLEAQALDGGDRRLGTLSAAAAAHLGIVAAIVAVTAVIVPPVHPPDLPEGITVILPPAIPVGEASPPPSPPRPLRGSDQPGVRAAPLPPSDPVTEPTATPDTPPEAPLAEGGATDRVGTGVPGNPDGDDHGVPGGAGTGPAAGDGETEGTSPRALTGDMQRPVLLSKVEPVYPTTARIARLAGRVTVEAVIGLDGRVESAEVTSSTSSLFDDAALDAVRHWRYRPALMNGRPVRVYFKVAVEFVIR